MVVVALVVLVQPVLVTLVVTVELVKHQQLREHLCLMLAAVVVAANLIQQAVAELAALVYGLRVLVLALQTLVAVVAELEIVGIALLALRRQAAPA